MSTSERAGQAAGTDWNPAQYLRFADHRLRPAIELLERIPLESPSVIFDLGCGAGNVTRILAERWPTATVYGLDNSPDMLDKARTESDAIIWRRADIQGWSPERAPDLIYSNATLHWLDRHDRLFPRLLGYLRPGGCLAAQMPLSWGAPSHLLMRETLADGGIGGAPLGTAVLRKAVARKWVEDAEVYYDLLRPRCERLDIWETEYLQELEGDDPVLAWVEATGLRPILNGLGDEERALFVESYRHRLRAAYPRKANGRTLYPLRRLFLVARV